MRQRQSSLMMDTQYPVRSIGAACSATGGGPPRPPPPLPRWAWPGSANINKDSAMVMADVATVLLSILLLQEQESIFRNKCAEVLTHG